MPAAGPMPTTTTHKIASVKSGIDRTAGKGGVDHAMARKARGYPNRSDQPDNDRDQNPAGSHGDGLFERRERGFQIMRRQFGRKELAQ